MSLTSKRTTRLLSLSTFFPKLKLRLPRRRLLKKLERLLRKKLRQRLRLKLRLQRKQLLQKHQQKLRQKLLQRHNLWQSLKIVPESGCFLMMMKQRRLFLGLSC